METFLFKIQTESVPNVGTEMAIQIQEAFRTPTGKTRKELHIIIKTGYRKKKNHL